jgi:hypothetical protein
MNETFTRQHTDLTALVILTGDWRRSPRVSNACQFLRTSSQLGESSCRAGKNEKGRFTARNDEHPHRLPT